MRVAHLCLSCFYNDGQSYQENELVRSHVRAGHEVLVIASTELMTPSAKLSYCEPRDYMGADGARVIRLPYRFGPAQVARKLRVHSGVYRLLQEFRPDSILFHGACGFEIGTAARYARDNPGVLFYIDSHEDWVNSARGFVSREVLHKIYYRYCLSRAWPDALKILCVSTETMDFVADVYRVPRSKLEFYPLGGRPIPTEEYDERRRRTRKHLGLDEREIMFLQSGKQTRRKKLVEALTAFDAVGAPNARLFVAGTIDEEIGALSRPIFERNDRLVHLGWKSSEELTDLLCAADVYLQPGTQSVTMQHSLCCHCAVILDDAPSHAVYIDGNGWLINAATSLEGAISAAVTADLTQMQERSYAVAQRMLDYAVLSQRVLRADP